MARFTISKVLLQHSRSVKTTGAFGRNMVPESGRKIITGQLEEIDRVTRTHVQLTDNEFVKDFLMKDKAQHS